MDRNLVRTLLAAWEHPEFRAGLQHLVDLDEVSTLLAAMSVDGHDDQVEARALELLRSALDDDEIRRALLLVVETDEIRRHLVAVVVDSLAEQPTLAESVRSALEDPDVRRDLHAALESASVRALVWRAAQEGATSRWALIRSAITLLIRHRPVRRLALALRRHGVLRELRHSTRPRPHADRPPVP